MVKGISRQIILVQGQEEKLFEQAIFILKDSVIDQDGVTDDVLMKEAKRLLGETGGRKKMKLYQFGPAWACCGALLTGLVWLLTVLF